MRSAHRPASLLLVFVTLSLASVASGADGDGLRLFDPITVTPFFSYEAVDGDSSQPQSTAWFSYSSFFQASGGSNVMLMGSLLDPDLATVTLYHPVAGSPDTVDTFYDPSPPPGFSDSLVLVGPHLISGQPTSEIDGATTFIQADFEPVLSTQITIGASGTAFYLHGELLESDDLVALGLDASMRLWGEDGATAGKIQLAFKLDQVGRVPSEPANASGAELPIDTVVYLSGDVTLGAYTNPSEPTESWTFSSTLYDGNFGLTSTGRIQVGAVIPEPGTLALLALGVLGVVRRRR